jgi:hypothetical protein
MYYVITKTDKRIEFFENCSLSQDVYECSTLPQQEDP